MITDCHSCEALLVSSGSFLLWCSKGEDVTNRSLADRMRIRRVADDEPLITSDDL